MCEVYEVVVVVDGVDVEDVGGNVGVGMLYDAYRSEGEIVEGAAAGTIVFGVF